jgi:mutator protein MutT
MTGTAGAPPIVVTAAVIERDNMFLVTRRLRGVHLEGCWEFPGGKCEAGETFPSCLSREIREELDTAIRVGPELFSITHPYPDRVVELHFFACELAGEPRPMLGQEMRWVARGDLAHLEFPPADQELIALLRRNR